MTDPAPRTRRRRYRFGLGYLLATILIVGTGLGLTARAHHRAQERTAVAAELEGLGVGAVVSEPTGVALLVRKFAPGREDALTQRLGRGWFSVERALVCWKVPDERVASVVERLRRLGTVREVYTHEVTPAGIAALEAGLPGVNVVPWTEPARHAYARGQGREMLAVEGLVLIVVLLASGLLLIGLVAWPFRRRRASDPEFVDPPAKVGHGAVDGGHVARIVEPAADAGGVG